jgi:hypothetical protein
MCLTVSILNYKPHHINPQPHQTFRPVLAVKLLGDHVQEIDIGQPLFTLLQPEMLTNAAISGWCDQPLSFYTNSNLGVRQ